LIIAGNEVSLTSMSVELLGPGLHIRYSAYYATQYSAGYVKAEDTGGTQPVLDLDNPAVYPYAADWRHPDTGAEFFSIGTRGHVNHPDDPQFFFIRHIIPRIVERQPGRPWVGLYEDVACGIVDKVNALRQGREAGWLEAYMKGRRYKEGYHEKERYATASWDLTPREIATLFLAKNSEKLPAPFKAAWAAANPDYTVGDVLAYHFFELIKHTQILDFKKRQKDGLPPVDDPDTDQDTYAYNCLKNIYGVTEILEEHGADFSKGRRKALHAQACAEAGVDIPFDVLEAFNQGCEQTDYAELIWPPLSMHPDDYYEKCNLFKLVAGMIGGPLRNDNFAKVASSYLKRGVNVVAIGGGGHVYWAGKYMHEQYGIPLRGAIAAGRVACGGLIQGLASAEPGILELTQQIKEVSRASY
jgi:hypothetical protein